MTFSIHSIPYYNHEQQQYRNVLCIDRMPDIGSQLNQIVKLVKFDKVSQFKQGASSHTECSVVIMDPSTSNSYAHIDNITSIISWLMKRGFVVVMTPIGELLKVNKTFVCFVNEGVKH